MSEKLEKEEIVDTHTKEVDADEAPTDEDWKNLREVADTIPISAFLVILIELCERFTYYGLNGPFQNYIQFPDPGSYPAAQPGAMGKGHQTATALTTFFQFWCYITPIFGAIVADQYLGKYKAILLFSAIYMVGLIILTCTSIPSAISSGASFPGYIVSIIIIGLGTGGIKSNVSPLVAEQYTSKAPFIRTQKNGTRVIVTPQATYQRIFNFFYWGINVGGMSSIATTQLEKHIGFWAAYLLPTCMFVPCIAIVVFGRKRYVHAPPRGSVFLEAAKIFKLKFKVGSMEACKPSNLATTHPELVSQVTWDDIFIDELKRALKACIVFCWFPFFWLSYQQITNNLISQAATMLTGNVPNDIIQNVNSFAILIIIPLMDRIVYPTLRRFNIPFRPIARISVGFFFAAVAMAYTAGTQARIYRTPPNYDHPDGPNWISAAYQIPSYVFVSISEIFASITGLEYAYKKAPQSMKSIVMALFLFANCFASILAFALVPVTTDPKMTWLYLGICIPAAICSVLIYVIHHGQDATDVEDDAIARDDQQMVEYYKNQKVKFEKAEAAKESEKDNV